MSESLSSLARAPKLTGGHASRQMKSDEEEWSALLGDDPVDDVKDSPNPSVNEASDDGLSNDEEAQPQDEATRSPLGFTESFPSRPRSRVNQMDDDILSSLLDIDASSKEVMKPQFGRRSRGASASGTMVNGDHGLPAPRNVETSESIDFPSTVMSSNAVNTVPVPAPDAAPVVDEPILVSGEDEIHAFSLELSDDSDEEEHVTNDDGEHDLPPAESSVSVRMSFDEFKNQFSSDIDSADATAQDTIEADPEIGGYNEDDTVPIDSGYKPMFGRRRSRVRSFTSNTGLDPEGAKKSLPSQDRHRKRMPPADGDIHVGGRDHPETSAAAVITTNDSEPDAAGKPSSARKPSTVVMRSKWMEWLGINNEDKEDIQSIAIRAAEEDAVPIGYRMIFTPPDTVQYVDHSGQALGEHPLVAVYKREVTRLRRMNKSFDTGRSVEEADMDLTISSDTNDTSELVSSAQDATISFADVPGTTENGAHKDVAKVNDTKQRHDTSLETSPDTRPAKNLDVASLSPEQKSPERIDPRGRPSNAEPESRLRPSAIDKENACAQTARLKEFEDVYKKFIDGLDACHSRAETLSGKGHADLEAIHASLRREVGLLRDERAQLMRLERDALGSVSRANQSHDEGYEALRLEIRSLRERLENANQEKTTWQEELRRERADLQAEREELLAEKQAYKRDSERDWEAIKSERRQIDLDRRSLYIERSQFEKQQSIAQHGMEEHEAKHKKNEEALTMLESTLNQERKRLRDEISKFSAEKENFRHETVKLTELGIQIQAKSEEVVRVHNDALEEKRTAERLFTEVDRMRKDVEAGQSVLTQKQRNLQNQCRVIEHQRLEAASLKLQELQSLRGRQSFPKRPAPRSSAPSRSSISNLVQNALRAYHQKENTVVGQPQNEAGASLTGHCDTYQQSNTFQESSLGRLSNLESSVSGDINFSSSS